jgi:hypothetical protein
MNWAAIGAIGELIGATGVILSLLYVGIQLKQHTKEMRSTAHREGSRVFADANHDIASNEFMSKLVIEAFKTDPDWSSPLDEFRFALFGRSHFMRLEMLWNEVELGVGPRRRWEKYRDFTKGLMQLPHWREFWERDRHIYDPDFAAEIDAADIGDLGVTPTRAD